MYPNHDVVVFQTLTRTASYLGSILNYTFYSNSTAPPVSTSFLDLFISPFYPNAPPSVAFVVVAPLYCTHIPPPLPEQSTIQLEFTRTLYPPASAARLCALRHVPASATVSCYCAPPHFPPSAYSQVPISPWGVLLSRVNPLLCAYALPSLSDPSSPRIFWCLVLCRVDFRARVRGQGTYTPWQLLSLLLAPPATWPYRRCSVYLDPPHSTLSVFIPSLLVESGRSVVKYHQETQVKMHFYDKILVE